MTSAATDAWNDQARRWGLTPRQTEVMHLIALGCADKEIAQRLGCSLRTTEHHVAAVLRKSGQQRRGLVVMLWSDRVVTTPSCSLTGT